MTKRVYTKKGEKMWRVALLSTHTGKKIHLEVSAGTIEEANDKCSQLFVGTNGDYEWLSTGPLHTDAEQVRTKKPEQVSTKQLVEELNKREGVASMEIEPYVDVKFTVNGPAIALIVRD